MKMLILAIILATKLISYHHEMGMETIYPETGIVVDLNYETDEVTFECHNGNQFTFTGIEDWYEGDIVAAIMYNNFTKNSVYDDKILSVKYAGWYE